MTPDDAIRLFGKTLGNLDAWMSKAEEYAKARGFEVDVLAKYVERLLGTPNPRAGREPGA